MPSEQKRTISLPAKEAHYVDLLVSSGAYESESDVIRAGLQALRERESALEKWLSEDVLPTVRAMEADPDRGLSSEEVGASLQARHAEWMRKHGRR